jgi:hypothetical protein
LKNLLLIFFLLSLRFYGQTCTAAFSYAAQAERLIFNNNSTVTNAHYYWNVGDGTSSYLKNPIHEFPTNGIYLTTLYVFDTLSKCSDFYEMWLTITKYSNDSCYPLVVDSIYSFNASDDYLKIIDLSTNCSLNYPVTNYAVGVNPPSLTSNTFPIQKIPSLLISTAYYTNGSNAKAAFKTSPNRYDRSENYQDCSANFEFSVVSENAWGQRIRFTAMNKNATNYKWHVSGLGDQIVRYTDTISEFFWGDINFEYPDHCGYPVTLFTIGQNGCKDTVHQHFLIRRQSVTYVGVDELNTGKSIQLSVWPNPVRDRLNIEQGQGTRLQKITLQNVLGQIVTEIHKPEGKLEIRFESLPAGIYLLKAEDYVSQKTFKVIKE